MIFALIMLVVICGGITFASLLTDWHQVEITKTKCDTCDHIHKEYKLNNKGEKTMRDKTVDKGV